MTNQAGIIIVGVSTLYHLGKAGGKDAFLLERRGLMDWTV